jgi:hypothetical protein
MAAEEPASEPADAHGGGAAPHARRATSIRVAPATAAELNTLRPGLFPFACWRLNDVRFDFDSSFVKPEAAREVRQLADLMRQHPGSPLSLFGHADPVGDEDHNKKLSGRRATAIFALLTRRVDLWQDLFDRPLAGDEWGLRAVQRMLGALGHDAGPPDGVQGTRTTLALRAFQRSQGLSDDGQAGPQTRKALFTAYMDALCTPDFVLTPADFLARGADPDGKGDFQGCSEFNPILRFSRDQETLFRSPSQRARRNERNARNRRVVAYLFAPGSQVDPGRWPCPSATAGAGACRKRFWSDHEERAAPQDEERVYETTRDTFRCRFYDRMATRSPCESLNPIVPRTWVRLLVKDARSMAPVPGVALHVRSAAGELFTAVTDAGGGILVEGLVPGPVRVTSAPADRDAMPVMFERMGAELERSAAAVSRRSERPLKATSVHIAMPAPEPSKETPRRFVDVSAPASTDTAASEADLTPFERDGLPTTQVHEILVSPVDTLTIRLRDEHDFPIPEAAFEITLADLSVQAGRLDREGQAVILNPPEGPYEVRYLDLDDVKAKSLAGRVRKACAVRDLDEVYRVLLHSRTLLALADTAYTEFFNDLSGRGLAEDIQDAAQHSPLLVALQSLLLRAGLPSRRRIQFDESAAPDFVRS